MKPGQFFPVYATVVLIGVAALFASQSIESASILKLSPGMGLSDVLDNPISEWDGMIGTKGNEKQDRLKGYVPAQDRPFHAILTPPKGFRYLGVPLAQCSLYFVPQDGEMLLFGITLSLNIAPEQYTNLEKILKNQFGPQLGGHWAEGSTVLLFLPPELGLFDLQLQREAERLLSRQ